MPGQLPLKVQPGPSPPRPLIPQPEKLNRPQPPSPKPPRPQPRPMKQSLTPDAPRPQPSRPPDAVALQVPSPLAPGLAGLHAAVATQLSRLQLELFAAQVGSPQLLFEALHPGTGVSNGCAAAIGPFTTAGRPGAPTRAADAAVCAAAIAVTGVAVATSPVPAGKA
ncbi:MAG: hypothetical protein E6I76_17370 [Chloroflexi bacterium]|nr:MAG: hypothetical protein E6I76_17370 [Chloroflexota bacterium]